MIIETRYNIGDKRPLSVDNGSAVLHIRAITCRINGPADVRILYQGTLYQHTTDKNGELVRWGSSRPWSCDEEKLQPVQKPAPAEATE